MFPELRANVGFLWENRKLWNEMYLADIEADTSKTPSEKEADRVSILALTLFWHCPPERTSCPTALVPARIAVN